MPEVRPEESDGLAQLGARFLRQQLPFSRLFNHKLRGKRLSAQTLIGSDASIADPFPGLASVVDASVYRDPVNPAFQGRAPIESLDVFPHLGKDLLSGVFRIVVGPEVA